MAQIIELINDAFDDLGIKPAEAALTESEVRKGVRYYNRVITSFDAAGLHLGVRKGDPDLLGLDESFVPDWAEMMVVSFLAISLAPAFGREVNPALKLAADTAFDNAILSSEAIPTHYPVSGNLPTGSGNHGQYSFLRSRGRFAESFQDSDTQLSDGGHGLADGSGDSITIDDEGQ